MAFRFNLAAVLRLREIDEQREERLLTKILAQLAEARGSLLTLDAQLVEVALRREAALGDTTAATELHASYALAALLRELRQAGLIELARLEQQRDQQVRVYQAAHQGHEVLLAMREKQRALFLVERARSEQKSLDDTFIARRLRRH